MSNETPLPPLQPLVQQPPQRSLVKNLLKQREFVLQSIVFIPTVGKFEVSVMDINHELNKQNIMKVMQDSLEEALGLVDRMECSNGRTTNLLST